MSNEIKNFQLAIIGLGYVGLPLALEFAKKRKIVWDNGSDKKKRSLSKSDIKNGKTIAILKELNFYNGITSQKSNKKDSNNESASNDEIVNQLEALKKLFDDILIKKSTHTPLRLKTK